MTMTNYSTEDMTVTVEWNQLTKLWEAVSVIDEDKIITTNNNRNQCIVDAQRKGYRVELKNNKKK
jgi:hypothetical protein